MLAALSHHRFVLAPLEGVAWATEDKPL
jgi:hypothetical protein